MRAQETLAEQLTTILLSSDSVWVILANLIVIAVTAGITEGCGDQACEDKIKEDTAATSRCMPFAQEHLSDKCVCCGKPAKKMVYWGRAY